MSLSWYVMARCRGEPLIALPVFPLRMFIHPYLFCRNPVEISGPGKVKGKTIGIQQYRITVGLWARGILHERHGVHHAEVQWVTSEPQGADYRVPANVKLELQTENTFETLFLLNGELDAVILPNIAQSFRSGDPRIHRVFADCRESVRNYFQDTGIFPITHTLVTHERMISQHLWLCQELVTAFNEADWGGGGRRCRLEYEYPKRFSFPTAVLFLEEEEQQLAKILGLTDWDHDAS